MKRMMFFITTIALCSQSAYADATIKKLMDDKLKYSQQMVKGLATEDYKILKESSEMLRMISKAVSWHKPDNLEFQKYYQSFKNAVDNMDDAVAKKNLDAAALSYMQITFTCMECHRALRKK